MSTTNISTGTDRHDGAAAVPPGNAQRVTIYRPASGGDATLGGVSATHANLSLVGWVHRKSPSVSTAVQQLPAGTRGPWGITEDTPPVALIVREGRLGRTLHLAPVTWSAERVRWEVVEGTMFGGNYAAGDGRFSHLIYKVAGLPTHGPVKIHDRIEG